MGSRNSRNPSNLTTLSIFYKQRPKWATGWMFFQFWQCCLTVAYFHLKSFYSVAYQKILKWCCLSYTGDCRKVWIQILQALIQSSMQLSLNCPKILNQYSFLMAKSIDVRKGVLGGLTPPWDLKFGLTPPLGKFSSRWPPKTPSRGSRGSVGRKQTPLPPKK